MEVVFLSYANSSTNPLPNLMDESETVYRTFFSKGRDRNFMPFYAPFSTISKINSMLDDCEGRVSVFSFSGHAGPQALVMMNEVVNPTGIGMHLKKSIDSKVLRLVVLNGCATKKHVKTLLDLGVPVVIATSTKVNDKAASEFAKMFYKSLCENEKNIIDSFYDGLSAAQTALINESLTDRKVRHLDYLDNISDNENFWEIFAKDEGSTRRKVIPLYNANALNFRKTEKILKTIYTIFLNAQNPQIVALWQREQKENVPGYQKENEIINSIPRPIGLQLGRLLRHEIFSTSGDGDVMKLRQLGQLFQSTNEFLAIIMIAQLWEIRLFDKNNRTNSFLIPNQIKQRLKEYLELKSDQRDFYNYSHIVTEIKNFLNQSFNDPLLNQFISRQKVVSDFINIDEQKYLSTCAFLQDLRKQSFQISDPHQAQEAYMEGEEYLCDLLEIIGFVHKYKLKSVHFIEALKKRHEAKAAFMHSTIPLNAVSNELYQVVYEHYLDSHGIVIVLNEKNNIADFLNLSPFLIDSNVFDEEADKCTVMVLDEILSENLFSYKSINDPFSQNLEIDDNDEDKKNLNDKISSELKAFRSDLLS